MVLDNTFNQVAKLVNRDVSAVREQAVKVLSLLPSKLNKVELELKEIGDMGDIIQVHYVDRRTLNEYIVYGYNKKTKTLLVYDHNADTFSRVKLNDMCARELLDIIVSYDDIYSNYYYTINEHTGTMEIYTHDNRIVSEISGCKGLSKKKLNALFEETIDGLGR